jgi:ferrous iron transport protein A
MSEVSEPIGIEGLAANCIPLPAVREGQCGIVTAVEAGEAEAERLKAMGVCLGRKVMLVQAGDPLILKVLGSRIGVSARLASQVQVEPCPGDTFGGEPRGDER